MQSDLSTMCFRRVLHFGSSTRASRYGPYGLATTSLILVSMIDIVGHEQGGRREVARVEQRDNKR